jgi:hypothetical protein
MQEFEFLTQFLSGALDFPDSVDRIEALEWAGKALTQQINEYATQGWDVIDMHWLSEKEVMITFRRAVWQDAVDDNGETSPDTT